MSEKKLVNGRGNLGNEDTVATVVRLVILGGEPGVHRVSRLVCKGWYIVKLAVVVKKDITADEYYLEALTDEILYLLKSDEFDTMLNDTAAKLEYEVSNYAVNQFKVKKIYDGSDLYQ